MPAILVSLAGCAVNPRVDLSEFGSVGQDSVTLDTPFYPQSENQCGPAALATILAAAGEPVRPEDLTAQVFLPGREGSLQVELVAATRRHGRIPYRLAPRVDALMSEIAYGRPVLVLQNLRTPSFPAWHYAVLVGYDVERNAFQLNSGTEQGLWMKAPQLLRTWDWADRWAMVALRPGDLPADPGAGSGQDAEEQVTRYLRAVADFESAAGAEAALPAWRAAVKRWPEQGWTSLALGNQAYQSGHFEEAAEWYRRGLSQRPNDPALANNLAAMLGEAGCARAGETVLRPVAGDLDDRSAWAGPVEDTLRELARQEGHDPESCNRFALVDGAARPQP